MGAVAAGHELVAEIGAQVLSDGGNAVDAVVAMVAAGCVCEGTLTSFGGGGFLIVAGGPHDLDPVIVDYFVRQPGLEPRPRLAPWEVHALEFDGIVLHYGTGPASVAVPGVPRGLAHAARRFGRLGLAACLRPAADAAQEGVVLTRTQAGEHIVNQPLIMRDPDGAAMWYQSGTACAEGELFRQPHLAAAIEEIVATDGESAYTGNIARSLIRWSDSRGARISRADVERYAVHERTPLALRVGDVTMFANPQPSMGGGITVRLLEEMLAARARGGSRSPAARDLDVGRALVNVLREMDPPRTHCPEHGEQVVTDHVDVDAGILHEAALDALHERGAHDEPHTPTKLARSPNTTHVSAIDSDGMLAGATNTVGYGSGAFIPGTGIQLNNMLAEYDHTIVRPAGASIPSMMTPSILYSPRTSVQLGSAGSDRIPHAISQILERMWHGAKLEAAIRAPRFASDGNTMHAEPGFDDDVLEQLASDERVDELVRWSQPDPYFGTCNGTAARRGRPFAAGDPRREATGIVVGAD